MWCLARQNIFIHELVTLQEQVASNIPRVKVYCVLCVMKTETRVGLPRSAIENAIHTYCNGTSIEATDCARSIPRTSEVIYTQINLDFFPMQGCEASDFLFGTTKVISSCRRLGGVVLFFLPECNRLLRVNRIVSKTCPIIIMSFD